MQYIGTIQDANLGHSDELYVFESLNDAANVIRDAGTWRSYPHPDGTDSGAMLLSAPSLALVRVPRDSTPRIIAKQLRRELAEGIERYSDARFSTGPLGGVVRDW